MGSVIMRLAPFGVICDRLDPYAQQPSLGLVGTLKPNSKARTHRRFPWASLKALAVSRGALVLVAKGPGTVQCACVHLSANQCTRPIRTDGGTPETYVSCSVSWRV